MTGWLTVQEAKDRLGVSRQRVLQLVRTYRGKAPVLRGKRMGKMWLVSASSVERRKLALDK